MRDQAGATAIEYGLIVALIVIAIMGALQSMATGSTDIWETISARSTDVMN
ncbi:pilus assembly protein Flp/PilA [Altererythrobacter atlanticus]|nr:Flp family type IVb pilin [Croceibacterium atlanticum]MBB5733237.1 pilus assembly protein Flp/PilA [Croceibacterium atlanticum]